MKRKQPHLMSIPEGCTPEQKARFEAYNAQTLELFKKREERMAARRAARKAERAAAKEANKDLIASVKVGDVFSMSWGYDQTNVDFFQVIAKVGKESVRVRQVVPTLIHEDPGMMCADRTYEIPKDGTLLPKSSYSVFIKDQEQGDTKRIQVCDYYKDKKVYLKIGDHFAFKETESTAKHYESWYA